MPLDLNRELVPNPASTFFVRVEGDSMTGDGIGDGDLLIVDRRRRALRRMHRRLLRGWGVHRQTGQAGSCGAWLLPVQSRISRPFASDADNEFSIWGVVRHVVKTFK